MTARPEIAPLDCPHATDDQFCWRHGPCLCLSDPHAVALFDCPIHGRFEDLAVAAPGWCPKCDAKMPPTVEVAEAQGFTIDRHTYPWVAYTGPRFAPLVAFQISTPAWSP